MPPEYGKPENEKPKNIVAPLPIQPPESVGLLLGPLEEFLGRVLGELGLTADAI